MTRWARRGPPNNKNPLAASDWSDLKSCGKVDIVPNKLNDEKDFKAKQRCEYRRLKRIELRQSQKVCYNCRQPGHMVADCPEEQARNKSFPEKFEINKSDNTNIHTKKNANICFKCGSVEHTVSQCSIKLEDDQFPYANCFVCGQIGHLSRSCLQNPKGLYPNGGCCNRCGSVKHLNKDCSQKKNDSIKTELTLKTLKNCSSLDDEPTVSNKIMKTENIIKKTKKIVKF